MILMLSWLKVFSFCPIYSITILFQKYKKHISRNVFPVFGYSINKFNIIIISKNVYFTIFIRPEQSTNYSILLIGYISDLFDTVTILISKIEKKKLIANWISRIPTSDFFSQKIIILK